MASTIEAARLTEAHRLAQLRLGRATVAQLLTAWGVLDPANIDATAGAWLRLAVPLIGAQRRISATLAARYVTEFRAFEGADGDFVPTLADTLNRPQVMTALIVNGPVRLKEATGRGELVDTAARTAQVETARAGMRYALDGGRDTITDSVESDPAALGWARVTSGKTCAFCAMLASRGPVYKTARSAKLRDDGKRYHTGCHCSVEPVYDADAEWPAGSRELREQWDEATRGFSGNDALNAFRRARNS